jgi:hypothetical protein
VRQWSDFNEIQIRFLGKAQGVVDADDADLLALRSDETDLGNPDTVVDARLGADGASSVRGLSPTRPYDA